MPPRRFDLIAFDWDGTLSDSTAIITRCIQAAVADVGGAPPSAAAASYVIGMALAPALAHAAPDVPREKYAQLGQRYRHHFLAQRHAIHLFDGIVPLLRTLRERGHRLAVATGKTRAGLNDALQDARLRGLFDDSRTADETAGKPDPQMLHELMLALDSPPERTLMVGDTTHDLQLARNAGCASVAVAYGAHPAPDLAALNPLHIAHSVQDLQQWLAMHA